MKTKTKKVGDIGEFNLIDRISRILPRVESKDLLLGIGDDAAAIRMDNHRALLITCDIQVENRHFRLDHISPYQLGYRAMAVNLSDIAAMGGTPTYAVVSLGLPTDFPLKSYDQLFEGMSDALKTFGGYIIGGNLARTTEVLVVDITLLGETNPARIMTRAGARAGDRVFVTGNLGASGAGFQLLEKYGMHFPVKFKDLVERHLTPVPRVEAGRQIANSGIATAMIDVSDGVASDLYQICRMSHVGAEIREDQLPLADQVEDVAGVTGMHTRDLALHSGEDYELLFTVREETSLEQLQALSGIAVTEIGRIVPQDGGYSLIDSRGHSIPLKPVGWDHFNRANH